MTFSKTLILEGVPLMELIVLGMVVNSLISTFGPDLLPDKK